MASAFFKEVIVRMKISIAEYLIFMCACVYFFTGSIRTERTSHDSPFHPEGERRHSKIPCVYRHNILFCSKDGLNKGQYVLPDNKQYLTSEGMRRRPAQYKVHEHTCYFKAHRSTQFAWLCAAVLVRHVGYVGLFICLGYMSRSV